MTQKIRRIDWHPDWYIGGTFAKLTIAEHGLYVIALSAIYANGGPIANDLGYFTHACKDTHWRTVKAALDGLIAKGKLVLSADGKWLSNVRADQELGRAQDRLTAAAQAGHEAGKTHARRAQERRRQAKNNDLAQSSGSRRREPTNQQPVTTRDSLSKTSTESLSEKSPPATPVSDARPGARASAYGSNGYAKLIPDDWQPSDEALARLRKGRPDIVGKIYDERMIDFRLWARSKAVVTHDIEATWLGFMRRTNAPSESQSRRERAEAAVAAMAARRKQ